MEAPNEDEAHVAFRGTVVELLTMLGSERELADYVRNVWYVDVLSEIVTYWQCIGTDSAMELLIERPEHEVELAKLRAIRLHELLDQVHSSLIEFDDRNVFYLHPQWPEVARVAEELANQIQNSARGDSALPEEDRR